MDIKARRHFDRYKALACMDYIASHLNDERCDAYWCAYGLPDDYTEDDLHDIADNDTMFDDICQTFINLMSGDEAYNGGFYF